MFKHNRLVLNETEAKNLNEKLDLVRTPLDWINVITELYKENGFEFNINWNPEFKEIKSRHGKNLLAFYGRCSGNNIDLTNSNRALYGFSASDKDDCFATSLRINIGSGSGADRFAYDYIYLDPKDFPLMNKDYIDEYNDLFILEKQRDLQAEYNQNLSIKSNEFLTLQSKFISTNDELLALKAKAKKIQELYNKITNTIEIKRKALIEESKIKFHFDIPKPKSNFIDYTYMQDAINLIKPIGVELEDLTYVYSDIDKKYQDFADEFPEMFI